MFHMRLKQNLLIFESKENKQLYHLNYPEKQGGVRQIFRSESLLYNKMALKTLTISEDVFLKHGVKAEI